MIIYTFSIHTVGAEETMGSASAYRLASECRSALMRALFEQFGQHVNLAFASDWIEVSDEDGALGYGNVHEHTLVERGAK